MKKHFKEGNEVSSKDEWNDEPKRRVIHERMMRIWMAKNVYTIFGSSVQSFTHVQLFETPWTATFQASRSIPNSWSLLKLMCIESVMPSDHLILCHPLLLLPSLFPSIRVFSNYSVTCIKWPKYWSFSFSISPSNEYSGLIFFGIDWFDLLAVQGTLKSLLQHHNQFFGTQPSSWSNSHIHTWLLNKTVALIRCICVDKVMSF